MTGESGSIVVRRGGAQDVRFLRDMLHHAYYWKERAPEDAGPGPVALYVKAWGRPGDAAILAKLGRVYAGEENYAQAILVLSEARKQDTRNAEVLLLLARTLDAGGFFRDAILAYDDYLANKLSDFEYAQEDVDAALAALPG